MEAVLVRQNDYRRALHFLDSLVISHHGERTKKIAFIKWVTHFQSQEKEQTYQIDKHEYVYEKV